MHARTTELIEHLEKSRSDLRAAVDAVPAELRDKQPSPDKWSTAQVLEHLAHTESSVTGLLERGMRKRERAGLKPATDASAVLPTIDAKKLLDRATKFTAPETVRPTKNLNSEQAWQVLTNSRSSLLDTLKSADGIDVDSIRGPHPFLGELGFHQWIAFVGLHEARHAAQIRATATALRG